MALKTKSGIGTLSDTLDPPRILGVLDVASGLIRAADTASPLTIETDLYDFNTDGDWYRVEVRDLSRTGPIEVWTQVGVDTQFLLPTTGAAFLEISVPVPVNDTRRWTHGRYEIRYSYAPNSSDPAGVDRPSGVWEVSSGAPLTIDLIEPYSSGIPPGSPPTVTVYTGPAIPPEGITAGFLAGPGAGGLPFTIPDNTFAIPSGQWALGDTLHFYWSPDLIPDAAFLVGAPQVMNQTGNTFTLPASAISTSGQQFFFYTITDRAGNVSRPSVARPFTVVLLPAPTLQPIEFPLAPDVTGPDNLLNIADYVAGITARVPPYTTLPTSDLIQLVWGGQTPTPFQPVTTMPFIFSNLNVLIRDEYNNRRGPQPVQVTYNVDRGGVVTSSPPREVFVDLSVTGAVNPGEPGSPNPNLNPLNVFGQGSLVPNVLTADHADQPVTVSIVLWSQPDLPAPGQYIHMVWSDGTVVTPPFEITTQGPGDTVTFQMPWSIVAATGNGFQDGVHYFVASSATPPPGDNLNISPPQRVDVQDAVVLALAPPVLVDARSTLGVPIWNCDSFLVEPPAVPPAIDRFEPIIRVLPDTRFQLDETLTLVVRAFQPRLPAAPLEDTTTTLTQPITTAGQINGYTFRVPYDNLKSLRAAGTVVATSTSPLIGGVLGRGTVTMNGRAVLVRTYCDKTAVPPVPTP